MSTPGRVAAVLTAAGSGTRLGRDVPKGLVAVDGVPLVVRAAQGLVESGCVDALVITVPAEQAGLFASALTHAGEYLQGIEVRLVVGGPTRQSSVAAGLAAVPADVAVVLVHDAARALTPPSQVAEVVAAVRAGADVVVPVVPVTDSVVEVGEGGTRAVDRSRLRAVQTPQGFDRVLLDRAHARAAVDAESEATAATDDAQLCAALGASMTVVPGSLDAFKITTERDLLLAEVVVRARAPQGAS